MRYLLDTNACIDVMRGHLAVVTRMSAVSPSECAISTISSYELFTGVAKCADPDRERSKVERLLNTIVEVQFDQSSARAAGMIRGLLELRGETIGPYDILLAGQAIAQDLTLVTANMSEFGRVPNLRIDNWQVSLR